MDDQEVYDNAPATFSAMNDSDDVTFSDDSSQQMLRYIRRDKQRTSYLRRTNDPSTRLAFPRVRQTVKLEPISQESKNVFLQAASPGQEMGTRCQQYISKEGTTTSKTENGNEAGAQNVENLNHSPNIPKHWGRKGRQRNVFLREIELSSKTHATAKVGGLFNNTESLVTGTDGLNLPASSSNHSRIQPNTDTAVSQRKGVPMVSSTHLATRPASGSKKRRSSVLEHILDAEGVVRENGRSANQLTADLSHEDAADIENKNQLFQPRYPKTRVQGCSEIIENFVTDHGGEDESVSRQKHLKGQNTPVISGAWVQSPSTPPRFEEEAINSDIPRSLRQQLRFDHSPKEPIHPKSVLEAVLGHKTGKPILAGEDTLNSLMEILDAHDDLSMAELSAVLTTPLDRETLILAQNVTDRVSEVPSTQNSERKIFQRMDARLRAAREGLKHASRGMERVEDQFEALSIQHSHPVQCACCNGLRNVTLSALLLRALSHFSAQFYSWPKGETLKVTKLGFFALSIVIWYLTEIVLCDQYCHKDYATYMVGYGVDVNAPAMPWVTLTLILRSMKWVWGLLVKFMGHVPTSVSRPF